LVVLDQDLFDIEAQRIKSVIPQAVMMEGSVVSGSLEAFVAD
jgi:predicted amidohydrolase YtcJ